MYILIKELCICILYISWWAYRCFCVHAGCGNSPTLQL